MSFHKLDRSGKPILKPRSKQEPVQHQVRGETFFHYRVKVSIKQPDGKYKQILRHKWFRDDLAAEEYQRELLRGPSSLALSWEKAYRLWIDGNRDKFSQGHVMNTETTMKRWYDAFGVNSTVEGTTLAAFSAWVDELAKEGVGRGAQIKRGHLLAIARWCRKRGLVNHIPFEHAPKPVSREKKVRPATVEEFYRIAELLPAAQSLVWQMLGYTGMRLGAACGLLEAEIGPTSFTVLTKGSKRVIYPITAPIAEVIEKARRWKAEHGTASCPYLFCNRVGNRWTPTTYGRYVRQVCSRKENGLENITPHQLRHLAGTILRKENLSVNIIMAGLGHADQKSTHIYVDKTAEMRAIAMNSLIQNLYKNDPKRALPTVILDEETLRKMTEGVEISCPCCEHKLLMRLKLKPQP